MKLEIGKRYWFYPTNYKKTIRSGLFTGEYAKNGSAIIIEKNGSTWSIPKGQLFLKPEDAQLTRKK